MSDILHERRILDPVEVKEIKCICGEKLYYDMLEITDQDNLRSKAHRLFCTDCGLSMRMAEPMKKSTLICAWKNSFGSKNTLRYTFGKKNTKILKHILYEAMIKELNPDLQKQIASMLYLTEHNQPNGMPVDPKEIDNIIDNN